MEDITIEQLLKRENIKSCELAKKLGISNGLVSKIKSGNEIISEATQKKFQEVFPEYHLIGGKDRWKSKCAELENKILYYEARINVCEERISELESRLDEIHKLSTVDSKEE